MKMKLEIITLLLFLSSISLAGVDQGNPEAKSRFFNMKQNYMLTTYMNWSLSLEEKETRLRVDMPLEVRGDGHFYITEKDLELNKNVLIGMKLCLETKIGSSNLKLYWLGKDCREGYFIREFNRINKSIKIVKF